MIGIRTVISTAIAIAIVGACMTSVVRRLIYIEQHYTLKGLIEHEKNSK